MTNALQLPRARLADLAFAAYLAPVIEGRRVAVVGPTSGEVALRARALGASTVVAFGGVGEDIAVRALTPGALAAFHGRLDVVLVPDAGAVPSLVAVLDEARRALGSEGIVAVATEPADAPAALEPGGATGPGYGDLYELCAARFAAVRMVGRGPFLGYTLAALDEASDRVALDTRLIDGDPPRPEAFLAVASDSPVSLDPLALVQIPETVIEAVRAGASRKLEAELARRDQKLKETEGTAAERWVKLQRYEHDLKNLDEEARKARDRAARLAKELDDERKLRQRIELDAQMVRRAPELPKAPDLEPELRAARERVAELERDLAAARTEAAAAQRRLDDLVRELDETQDHEAALRAELDEALERTEVVDQTPVIETLRAQVRALQGEVEALRDAAVTGEHPVAPPTDPPPEIPTLPLPPALPAEATDEAPRLRAELSRALEELAATQRSLAEERASALAERAADRVDDEYARLEKALAERGAAVAKLQAERAAFEQAVRELSFTVERLQSGEAEQRAQRLETRLGEMKAVSSALAEKAEEIVHENELLRERLARVEAQAIDHASATQQARWETEELRREMARAAAEAPAPTADQGALEALRAELAAAQSREATLDASLEAMTERATTCEAAAKEAERVASDERAARSLHHAEALEARNEVSRLYALQSSMEGRIEHLALELEGTRAGHARRVRELEVEVEQLVRAMEVAGAQAAYESRASATALEGDLEALRAEHQGVTFRLREAEQALAALATQPTPTATPAPAPAPQPAPAPAPQPAVAEGALDALRAEHEGMAFRLREAERALAEMETRPAARREEPGWEPESESVVSRELLGDFDDLDGSAEGAPAAPSFKVDQVLADLSATAERLAQTEEALAQAQQALASAEAEADALRAKAKGGEEAAQLREALELARRETTESVLTARTLLAQLEDRDQTLRNVERRLAAEVAQLRDELTQEIGTLRAALVAEERANEALRAALDGVRVGLSSILIDGRGAVVAHDLVSILRQIEAVM